MTDWELGAWHWCLRDGSCYIAWLDHWQTLLTGLLALAAAVWAAFLAKGQLAAARQQAAAARSQIETYLAGQTDERRRSLRAARASLPSVLSAICDHAEKVAAALEAIMPVNDVFGADDSYRLRPTTLQGEVPRFPEDLIQPLQEVLRHADDEGVIARIASVFREAQVLDARTRPLGAGEELTPDQMAGYILEAATLYARAESLFGFARGHGDTVDPDNLWSRVFIALDLMRVRSELVRGKARSERAEGLLPGEADTQPVL